MLSSPEQKPLKMMLGEPDGEGVYGEGASGSGSSDDEGLIPGTMEMDANGVVIQVDGDGHRVEGGKGSVSLRIW